MLYYRHQKIGVFYEKGILDQGFRRYVPLFHRCFCRYIRYLLDDDSIDGIRTAFLGFFLLIYKPLIDDNIYQAELASSSYVAPNVFVVFGIVAVVYSLIYGISFSIRSKEKKTKNKNSEYKSVYKSSK